MRVYGLSKTSFPEIEDGELDKNLIEIISAFPRCRENYLRIMLKRKRMHVPRWLVRDSIRRVVEHGQQD